MKIRIGFGLGTRTTANDGDSLASIVDDLERLGFDSLWLSERVGGDAPDPVAGMAFAMGRTTRLKYGMSVMVLPGRNPVLVAKAMASLDRLSKGRLIPAFGLGVADPHEQQAFGVGRRTRAKIFDEALPLIRRLWSEDTVDHHGDFFQLEGVRVLPKPLEHLDVWLGGIAPSELRRVGRLGDGWLPSFCDAVDVRDGITTVNQAADATDREIDPEHMGALIAYSRDAIPDLVAEVVKRRRPDKDPKAIIPVGLDGLRAAIEAMVEVGASKFVVLPITEPDDWTTELEELAEAVLPLEAG